MENQSFNLILTNLLIGLTHGHPYLRPASTRVKNLGYEVFCIERKIYCSSASSSVTPEAIIYSDARDHSLVTEWTEMPSHGDDGRKIGQLNKYFRIEKQDLVTRAGMPDPGASLNSLWFVVPSRNVDGYLPSIQKFSHRIIVSSFDMKSRGGVIEYKFGEIQDVDLANILKDGITAKRIPMFYMPVSIENLKTKEFVTSIVQEVVSFAVKGQYVFSSEEICSSIFSSVWDVIGIAERRGVSRSAKSILKNLESKDYLQEWLRPTGGSTCKWKLTFDPKKDFSKTLSKMRNRIEIYLAKEFKGVFQLDLFEDND